MPAQNRAKSKQDYQTPDDFIDAVRLRFGPLAIDLAATAQNRKAPIHLGLDVHEDALSVQWPIARGAIGWLNPPFAKLDPWVAKCVASRSRLQGGARILLLVPASIGACWFLDHVHGKAFVHALSPRLKFIGCKDPYPKDCILAEYGAAPGFDVWRWK